MMDIDPVPGFRAELMAALRVLDPQIDGLQDLMAAPSISPQAKEVVAGGLGDRTRRRDLIRMLIEAMDEVIVIWNKLKDDGYPATPKTIASMGLFDELKKEADAVATAMEIFEALPLASTINMTLGGATNKET